MKSGNNRKIQLRENLSVLDILRLINSSFLKYKYILKTSFHLYIILYNTLANVKFNTF